MPPDPPIYARSNHCTLQEKCWIRPWPSSLDPLLFLIYVNHLPNCLSFSNASMLADNTNLTTTGISAKVVQNQLNEDLEKVHWWLLANKFTLNIKKKQSIC